MADVKLIAAIDDKRGIAKSEPGTPGRIPWYLPSDRKYLREQLKPGPVLVGWNTFADNGYKPYGVGKNTVVTNGEVPEGVSATQDPVKFLSNLEESIWVAGGGQVFKQVLPYATHLYLTRVEGDFGCDIFFPEFEDKFVLTHEEPAITENGIRFTYQIWEPKVT